MDRLQSGLGRELDDTQPAFVGNQKGDVRAVLASAAKTIEAVYSYPYENHAAMEPLNATALYTSDRCEVWTGTQDGELALATVVEHPVGQRTNAKFTR